MAVTIREGGKKDLAALIELVRELAAFEKMPDAVMNSAAQAEKDMGLFGFFVAEEDGGIVGYALYFFTYSTWVGKSLYLDDLYVKPEFRGRGTGSMLLRRVCRLAEEENCRRMRWQVLRWNTDAISFYKKHGALISSEWLNCDFDEKDIGQFLRTEKPKAL